MASVKDWLEGARIRTLPASIAPVIIGGGITFAMGRFSILLTLLAAGVALFMQIGVNFANDYSDGVRGTDEYREGPPRLTGGGKAAPGMVKVAAFVSFGIACAFGIALVWLSGYWWLLALGAAALLAAWFYTGGKHPYGYAGLGELFVLIFFGYMATIGTVYTQTGKAPLAAWLLATGIGLIACALLMVNNIRDIPSDAKAGKRTLAVRLGEKKARWAYYALLAVPVVLASAMNLWGYQVLFGMLAMLVWVIYLSRPVVNGAKGAALLPVLRNTGLFELVYAVVVAAGLVFTTLFPDFYWSIAGWAIVLVAWVIWMLVEIASAVARSRRKAAIPAAASPEAAAAAEPEVSSDSEAAPPAALNTPENS